MKHLVALALLVPAVAAADPAHFVTIDRQDDSSRMGGELSYLFLPSNAGDVTVMRFDVHGQYVDPVSGIGGYVSVPFGYIDANESDQALGDVELGAIYSVHLASPNTKLILHAGLTLPTEKNSLTSLEIAAVSSYARFADYYQSLPKGTSLRLGMSPIVRQGQVFARADVGVDANLSDSESDTAPTVLRFQFGVGVDLGQAALMLESTNLYATSQGGNGGGWINTGAVSARFDAGDVYPYGALVFGLDDDAQQGMDAAITAGIEGKLR